MKTLKIVFIHQILLSQQFSMTSNMLTFTYKGF